MTIAEAISLFDIIQDKVNSPYFTAAEKVQFMNSSQDEFVNELIYQHLFPSHRGGSGGARVFSSVEANVMGAEVLEPLFVLDLSISSTASGTIARSEIKSAMNLETGDSTDYLAVLSVAKDLTTHNLPVQYVRINDFHQFQRNEFKKATDSSPQYRIERNKLRFLPSGISTYLISVIKQPVRVVYDEATPANNVDFELPDWCHDSILAIALDKAGVASRDSALLQLKQMADKNLTTLA